MKSLYPELELWIPNLKSGISSIAEERKAKLQRLSEYLVSEYDLSKSLNLIFICTHNSRRSIISEIWASLFAYQMELKIYSYSGGTEETAFHQNAINAMAKCGFRIKHSAADNGRIQVYFSDEHYKEVFSKEFDHSYNPLERFIAIMTCSDANEACPVIPGAKRRFALEFEDPKKHDNSPQQDEAYLAKVNEIGSQLLYLFQLIKKNANV